MNKITKFFKKHKKQQNDKTTKIKVDLYVNSNYVNLDDRINIYANETDTFISLLGQKCIDFEETLSEYVECYNDSVCPYCKTKIELPKQRKTCPHCNKKIYVIKSGIGQGMMVLKEEDKIHLSKLKDDFYEDRKYNENYGHGIVVENNNRYIK